MILFTKSKQKAKIGFLNLLLVVFSVYNFFISMLSCIMEKNSSFKITIILMISFFALISCKTVSKKVDKAVLEEEQKLTKFLNRPVNELKIELGEPDLVEINSSKNKDFIYFKSKFKIRCERKFEVNPKNKVIGFSSKNCF